MNCHLESGPFLSSASVRENTIPFPFRRRSEAPLLVVAMVAIACYAGSARGVEIGSEGMGISGINDALDGDAGIPRFNAGVAANINDGDPNTRVDTWFNDLHNDKPFSFVGVVWPTARYESIETLTLTLATFTDGGWFGHAGATPLPGEPLEVSLDLVEPTIQVSTDGGSTWTTVDHTSDYIETMTGHEIGGGDNPNPTSATAVFTLSEPAVAVDGIRILGENGGLAGPDENGFLGVFELEIEAQPAVDSDADGLPDLWEDDHGLNVGENDADGDLDEDGLTNGDEFEAGTNPELVDTDGDGLDDPDELETHGTDPLLADTDGDGLDDGAELDTHETDPTVADTDGDGVSDGDEVNEYGSDPLVRDSDADGFSDGLEVSEETDPANPASYPSNAALKAAGIMGVNDAIDEDAGTQRFHAGEGASINDGDLETRVDNWWGAGETDNGQSISFVGVIWDAPLQTYAQSLTLTLATFTDGGWFGVSGETPGAGGPLDVEFDYIEPTIQISEDGGDTWSTVGHTSDYSDAMSGHTIGGGDNPNPTSFTAEFTLDEPVTEITGIRIIGENGGDAGGDANGFIGVFELVVTAGLQNDSDNDSMDDGWETDNGLNVGTDDSGEDPDEDGLTHIQEFAANTDPQSADSDGDGLSDGEEITEHNSNPNAADTDGDGLNDGEEVNDSSTDPVLADTDGDGLNDAEEVNEHQTDPNDPDSDGDGFNDALEVALGSDPDSAALRPNNLALLGNGIMGTKESVESGDEAFHYNAGVAANINDADPATRVDTFNGGGTSTASFVGILWDEPASTPVERLELTHAIFFDGGWFGVNNAGPGSGGTLSSGDHLVEPMIQVTSDGGANWTTVDHTSDYTEALDGHPLPDEDFGPPTSVTATFELASPQSGIDGIRILGSEGGTASGGFLGVFELAVHTGDTEGGPQGVTLESLALVEGQIQFEFDSESDVTYEVQFKPSLSDATWETLSTINGDGTRQTFSASMEGAQGYYRVMSE